MSFTNPTPSVETIQHVNRYAREMELLLDEIKAYVLSLSDGTIHIGSATGLAVEQTLTGDVTVSNGGVTVIGSKKVLTSMVNDGAVTPVKMGVRTVVALPDAAASPTIAQLMSSSLFTMTPTASRTFTTESAAVIVAGISGVKVGSWFDFTIENLSESTAAYGITLTAGSGVTLVGSAVVYPGAATFRAILTNITGSSEALSIYRMEGALPAILSGVTAGTQAAGKVVIANSDTNTGITKVTQLHIGSTGSETQVTASPAELNKLDGANWSVGESNAALHDVVRWWVPTDGTLQALITAITDATATKQYTIMIPPGYIEGATITASSPLLLKPFINLKGYGGRARVTVFHNVGISFLDAAMTSGTQRLRLDGIRFETVALIMTAASHVMSVVLDDCPINNASSLVFTGTSYGSPSGLEIRNLNIDRNTTAMLYKFCQVSFWNAQLLGLYFEDADAYFFGCDIGASANCVNAGTAGGWFEFNHCKIDQMTVGDPASESVLATFGVGGSENIQVHGAFTGKTTPGSVAAFTRMRGGTQYFCHDDMKLYIKTADVGTNTWTVVGAQT
jgi:hypothetical protein